MMSMCDDAGSQQKSDGNYHPAAVAVNTSATVTVGPELFFGGISSDLSPP